eukprot:gene23269-31598_t
MESLGGNELFLDRFVAQHIAFFYYWIVVVLYMVSPATAYDLNKHVEQHAFNTYDEFLTSHADELKLLPAPQVAIDYYQKGDLYMFDAFQYNLKQARLRRRPVVESLYDVFFNIREDEAEHASTMRILQQDATLRSRGRT